MFIKWENTALYNFVKIRMNVINISLIKEKSET